MKQFDSWSNLTPPALPNRDYDSLSLFKNTDGISIFKTFVKMKRSRLSFCTWQWHQGQMMDLCLIYQKLQGLLDTNSKWRVSSDISDPMQLVNSSILLKITIWLSYIERKKMHLKSIHRELHLVGLATNLSNLLLCVLCRECVKCCNQCEYCTKSLCR